MVLNSRALILIYFKLFSRVFYRRPRVSPRWLLWRRHHQSRDQNQTTMGHAVRERQDVRQVSLPASLFRRHAHKKRTFLLQEPISVFDSQLVSSLPSSPWRFVCSSWVAKDVFFHSAMSDTIFGKQFSLFCWKPLTDSNGVCLWSIFSLFSKKLREG